MTPFFQPVRSGKSRCRRSRHSPAVFRKLHLITEVRTVKYAIDYRSGRNGADQPFWPEYQTLIDALSQWGVENSVNVHVLFMD